VILYIDTSTSFLYTGIVDNNSLIGSRKVELGPLMSSNALNEIASMFEENKLSPKDIKKIIVVNGPGSFTGIRIGVTIAKTYAWSFDIPIIQGSGLEAMAISTDENTFLVPVLDARRDYIFGAIYTVDKKEYYSPKHVEITELESQLSELDDYIIITNDEVNIKGRRVTYDPDILKIVNIFREYDTISPHQVNPDYLKLTEAEESRM